MKGLYNFRQTSDWVKQYVRILIKECRRIGGAARADGRPFRALDIGCGHGIGRSMELSQLVAAEVDELWGLEPDPTATPPGGIFQHYQNAPMETADLPREHFDLAYSFMVMEHVAAPQEFVQAVHRCLRPGGTYLFITVNSAHYFTIAAKTMKRLRIDEAMLRILRGRQEVAEYHYPVQYRFNRPAVIDRSARGIGFEPPEYAFLEEEGPKPYMVGPLRPVWALLMGKRRVYRNPRHLLTMIVRMNKTTAHR
jgi:SAM-dependent methyltransferase